MICFIDDMMKWLIGVVGYHCCSLRREDERHDQAVQRQGFSENENQNHAYEDLVLLSVGPHTRVSHDPNCQPGGLSAIRFTSELKPQQSPEARWA